jgi:hypothetical protein
MREKGAILAQMGVVQMRRDGKDVTDEARDA